VLKEQGNGWYGPGSYFSARLLADTPFQLIIPLTYVSLTYYLNGQPQEIWRFTQYSLIFLLTALISQCHGIVIGALLHNQITTAVYLGPITAMPFLLLSGFLVRVQRMPPILRPLTNFSFIRFSFEGVLLSIYGFNRCGDDAVDEVSYDYHSILINCDHYLNSNPYLEQLVQMKSTILAWFTRIFNIVQNAGECDDGDPLSR
jgi:ATP-binding cassette subfamily G (WHITE) protein 4